jgi:hypothetical protein
MHSVNRTNRSGLVSFTEHSRTPPVCSRVNADFRIMPLSPTTVLRALTFELFDQIRFLMLRGDRSWEQLVPLDPAGRLPVVILDCKVSKPQIDGMLLTPGWRLVYADPIAAVFLEERLADKLSLPLVSSEPLLISNQPSLR